MADAWNSAERLLDAVVGPGQSRTTHRVAHDFLVEFGRQLITRIADLSETLGGQAGVGGVETAGHLVSYLADHPEHLEPLLARGVFELPDNWIEHGRLTYHALNGEIVDPSKARRSRIINGLGRELRG